MRWNRNFLVIFMLLLAGCFRQADQTASTPTVRSDTFVPAQPQLGASPTTSINLFPVTATLPPVTILPAASNTPSGPTSTPIPIATQAPVIFPAGGQTPTVGSSTTFITPVSPLGPITPDVPTVSFLNVQPSATASGLITPTAIELSTTDDACVYVVASGDTFYQIALANGFTQAELEAANPDIGDVEYLSIGDEIKLPLPGCEGGTLLAQATATLLPTANLTPGVTTTYVVRSGDTLFDIARQFGVTVQAIVNANNLANPNNLSPGQELEIPPPANTP